MYQEKVAHRVSGSDLELSGVKLPVGDRSDVENSATRPSGMEVDLVGDFSTLSMSRLVPSGSPLGHSPA